jgi:uncharacterized LabA/DUF88 family protein
MDKAICIIDGGFISKMAEKYDPNHTIDYQKLISKMSADIPVLRSYFYTAPPFIETNPTNTQKTRQANFDNFKNALLNIQQLEIRLGRIKRVKSNTGFTYSQKGVDTLMAIDLVTFSTKKLISHAIMLTGDSDLVPAIQVAKNEGVIIKIITFLEYKKSTADQIRQVADIVEEWDKPAVSLMMK